MYEQSKTYRDLQVEFSSGLYGGLSFASVFAFLILDHWVYAVLIYVLIGSIFYRDKPLRFLLSTKFVYPVTFFLLFFFSAIAPVLILSLFSSALSELIGMLLIPIGAILIFIFLWWFYTHKRLRENGWVSVSGRFN